MLLASCATQEAPIEDFLRDAEGEFIGGGIATGDKGSFTIEEFFSDKKKTSGNVVGATAYDVDLPAMDQKSFEEYESFKTWRRAQTPTSAEYKEYQDWQAYQQYRRFKAQQQKQAPVK